MYSCCYPIEHTFNATITQQIDYDILVNGSVIYTATLLPFDRASQTVTISISEVCRTYLETFYENVISNTVATSLPSSDGKASMITFVVRSDSNPSGDASYQVVYDYNTDYIQPLPDKRYLNDPIDTRVDPRQRLFLSGYSTAQQQYTATRNGASIASGSLTSLAIQFLPFNVGGEEGDTIITTMTGVDSTTYTVTRECPHRYTLYYVNKYGALDALLCIGRDIEGWNPTRVDVQLYNDRGNRLDWEQKRINQEIDHRFTLNTGLLRDEDAEKIDHLIYSPKVFIHDLQEDTITSCIITDTSYSVKQHRYDRVVQYTINVTESQKQLR